MANDAPQSGPVPMPVGAFPAPLAAPAPVVYPDSDGEPMSDNTKQGRWIIVLVDNLKALFRGRPDVFIANNHLWYPVEGEPGQRIGPDVMVVFGRPKGDRGSYKQWEEGGVPVTVAFEVLSPGNTEEEMRGKYLFYEEHGVEEYYVYDPDRNRLEAYLRRGSVFRRVHKVEGLVSPRLQVRFEPSAGAEMVVYHPNGEPFVAFEDLAERYADERRRADDERRRADALARLVELGRKARRGTATAEELAELDRLDESAGA